MAHERSRPNGTPQRGGWSIKATKLAAMLCGTLMLASCQTTATTGTAAKCSGLAPITYSSSKDTPETVKQAKIHNAVLKKLGCV